MATKQKDSAGKGENRLAHEPSPYLRQHAHNPVDWYPWGDEALERARKEDRPIFLSIGYSTCHWCHVMAHESFEDAGVADLMNWAFVNIKVDREERPDIDKIYMAVCQAMTGQGGWPLSVLLTPDGKPFFAATYIPKASRGGMIGMIDLIPRIVKVWRDERKTIETTGEKLIQLLSEDQDSAGGMPAAETLAAAYGQLEQIFDSRYGGFGRAPKFPTPHNLTFLLRYGENHGDREAAIGMVEKTLREIHLGGITDHVGFGIHRYATDARWLVPHFEKMLYDQALLANAALEAFQKTKDDFYKEMADGIFTYVLRDMTSETGGFYTAEDADSEGEEGRFYVWRQDEINDTLSAADAGFVTRHFGTKPEGNFFDETSGKSGGANILHLGGPLGEAGNQAPRRWRSIRRRLYERRIKRIPPLKDDKILTDWNGLMIAALAKGGRVLGDRRYTAAAEHAAVFITDNFMTGDGGLHHGCRRGEAEIPAFLDDYAFFIWGLLELYRTTFDVIHLSRAMRLSCRLVDEFWDPRAGGFFFTGARSESLILRRKEAYDGAVPSGNAMMLWNFVRLYRKTGDPKWGELADALVRAFAAPIRESPAAHSQWLVGMDFMTSPSQEVVIVGEAGDPLTIEMVRALNNIYLPRTVVVLKTRENGEELAALIPSTRFQELRQGKTTVYVCQNFFCRKPTHKVGEMVAALTGKSA